MESKKYLIKTEKKNYLCENLFSMLDKITAFKIAGIKYQVQGL